MYEKDGAGLSFAKECNLTLGAWHPYKQGCLAIYKRFALTLFGPFYHRMHPKKKFKLKPTFLTVVETHFNYMMQAYGKVSKEFKVAYDSRGKLDVVYATLLANFYELFEFLLPTVRSDRVCLFTVVFIRINIIRLFFLQSLDFLT